MVLMLFAAMVLMLAVRGDDAVCCPWRWCCGEGNKKLKEGKKKEKKKEGGKEWNNILK
jgi:hypothetical protein